MKIHVALARALARNGPTCRRELVAAVAKHLAAGNIEAADELGRFVDRAAYGQAYARAAQLRRRPTEQAIARFVARCFIALRDAASRLQRLSRGRQ